MLLNILLYPVLQDLEIRLSKIHSPMDCVLIYSMVGESVDLVCICFYSYPAENGWIIPVRYDFQVD